MQLTGAALDLEPKSMTAADLDLVGYRVCQRMTPRELQITGSVVQGLRNREIAAKFRTTEDAVKYSLRKIFDKIGVFDRLELALYVLYHPALRQAIHEALGPPDALDVPVARWESQAS